MHQHCGKLCMLMSSRYAHITLLFLLLKMVIRVAYIRDFSNEKCPFPDNPYIRKPNLLGTNLFYHRNRSYSTAMIIEGVIKLAECIETAILSYVSLFMCHLMQVMREMFVNSQTRQPSHRRLIPPPRLHSLTQT